MEQESWLEETIRLLKDSSLTTRQVAEATGMNYHWIAGLRKGQFEDPGINKVEKIYRFLKEWKESNQKRRAANKKG